MEIIWNQKDNFVIKGKKVTIELNPAKASKADLVLSAEKDSFKDIKEEQMLFDWPGEYEAKNVPINAIAFSGKNIFSFAVEDINFAFVPGFEGKMSEEMVNKIGNIDVLIVRFKKDSFSRIIENIEPRVVLPFAEEAFKEDFTKLGIAFEEDESYSVSSRSSLPTDQTKYVLISPRS